jgi:hypothetical protein
MIYLLFKFPNIFQDAIYTSFDLPYAMGNLSVVSDTGEPSQHTRKPKHCQLKLFKRFSSLSSRKEKGCLHRVCDLNN